MLDGVPVAGVVGEEDFAGPAVVVDEAHLGFAPVVLVLTPVFEDGGDLVVAVLEDVGRDLEDVALDTLDRVAPASISGCTRSMMTGLGGSRVSGSGAEGSVWRSGIAMGPPGVGWHRFGRAWSLVTRYERTSRERAWATWRIVEVKQMCR